MDVKSKILENNVLEMDINVEKDIVEKEYAKACARISQQVNIPGFRKGKAPRALIEKHVGLQTIHNEVLDAILPKLFTQEIQKNNYDIISDPILKSYDLKSGKDLHAVANFELRPEVKLGEYKNINYEVKEYKVEGNALQNELNDLAKRFSTMEKVEGRKTKNTDVIFFDFDGKVGDEPINGGSAKNYMLDLAHSNFIPGFAEQLVDKNANEEFVIDVTFPEKYHDEKLQSKPAQFTIKINEIKERKFPEIDDELAKKAGKYENLEELKVDIEKKLKEYEKSENDRNAVEVIYDKVVGNANVDIQNSLIEREKQVLMNDLRKRVAQQGIEFETFLKNEDEEKIDKELSDEAQKRVKNSLVVSKIAQEEKIQVSPADISTAILDMSKGYGVEKETIYKELQSNPQMINVITQQILSEKVMEFLRDNNNVKFVK